MYYRETDDFDPAKEKFYEIDHLFPDASTGSFAEIEDYSDVYIAVLLDSSASMGKEKNCPCTLGRTPYELFGSVCRGTCQGNVH